MKIEIRALDFLNREIAKGWSNSELGAEDELARIIEDYKKSVCEFCDGEGEILEDEYDSKGQLVGVGTIRVKCSCQVLKDEE